MKILYTGPSGWDYYAWDRENTIESKTIHDHAIDLGLAGSLINENLISQGDDIESFREFIHVVLNLSERYGFTHVIDEEMEYEEPTPIRDVIKQHIESWSEETRFSELIRDLPQDIVG